MSAIKLESQDHRDLLDVIDTLRSLGVTRYIDLPQIIVCGDQSAGKSSVLEAISGLSFPRKDNLCTRFATELILRRDETPGVQVAIIPGPDRTPQESEDLSNFDHHIDALEPDLGSVIEEAKLAMGLSEVKVFSNDILRVELKGPDQPHLTLVDLPGLFRASNRDQSVDSALPVQQMVRSYMEQPRSIILAVVSAQSDFSLQPITELSRELDPFGVRTLGLITKPDTLSRGSDSETSYIALAQNRDVVFRLGWHVLKNRSFETRNTSSIERDRDETDFFSQGAWALLDRNTVGVQSLRPRLSTVLKDLILRQLPSLLRDACARVEECQQRLKYLGEPRGTIFEQRRYLRQVSWSFSQLMKGAVDGIYNDVFFGQASTEAGYQKRLRAVVQNELEAFAEDIRLKGRAQVIIEDDAEYDGDISSTSRITRNAYLLHIQRLMRRSRGCELPGTFNPLIVNELFREQSCPWEQIVISSQDKITKAARKCAHMIIDGIAVPDIVTGMSTRINQAIDKLVAELKAKTNEMLQPHLIGHPITYNHYLTDTVQKIQRDRSHRKDIEVDMNTYSSQLAADYMEAYYKVAMKRFVDDVSVLAIEQQLMQRLPLLFGPDAVEDLSDEEVASLAAESETAVSDRHHNHEKLVLLETTVAKLRQFQSYRVDSFDGSEIGENSVGLDHDTSPSHDERTSSTTVSETTPVGVSEPEEQLTAAISDPWNFTLKKSKKKRQPASQVWAD